MTATLQRLDRRALRVLQDTFPVPTVVPSWWEWPWRARAAALLCEQGRQHLAHNFRAWRALPGDRWDDPRRMVRGVVQGGPPGRVVVLCASAEVLRHFPGALEDPNALVEPARTRTGTFAAMYRGEFRPVVWLERDVDLRTWWPA